MIYYKTSIYTSRDNDIILNITIFTKITTNVLHGPPSKTLLYVINAILTTHVRVQSLKSVLEVTVSGTVGHQHVLESPMIIFRWVFQRVEKFSRSTLRKIKHRPMKSRISTAIGIDDIPSRSFLHMGGQLVCTRYRHSVFSQCVFDHEIIHISSSISFVFSEVTHPYLL